MIKLLIITAVSFFQPQAQDSLGVETINGKLFVVHKVGPKETLYAISKRYNTTVDAIIQQNPEVSSGLDVGQVIKVPYTKPVVVTAGKGGLIHVVAAKETLYSIARAYSISVDELKQWNNITDNSLSLGQELVIKKRNTITTTTSVAETPVPSNNSVPKGYHQVEAKETLFSISSKYSISVQQLRTWNALEGNELKIGQQLRVTPPQQEVVQQQVATTKDTPKDEVKDKPTEQIIVPTVTTNPRETTTVQPTTIRISESKNSDEISESGVAELIEGTEGNRKYLALHRTAPVGTILKVRNEMNNREVFVRVMGKLPDNALSDKVLIRISKSAFDRLGAIDSRFRVQVTYYK